PLFLSLLHSLPIFPPPFSCQVGKAPLPRHRFYAMSGTPLYPDIIFVPCRENVPAPTSFLCHVGKTPLPRHRFCAMSGERPCPDIVFMRCRENTSTPTSYLRHVVGTPS